jgi:signal peptidase II
MTSSLPRYLGYLAVSVFIIILDQITKTFAYQRLLGAEPIEVLPVLQWALVFNRGAAFGFLNNAGGIQHYFFSGLAIVVSMVILIWLWRIFTKNIMLAWGLVLVLAGAIGNLIDRIRFQYVIDFINLHYHDWYFPAFNIADMSITFGALLLILDAFGIGQNTD